MYSGCIYVNCVVIQCADIAGPTNGEVTFIPDKLAPFDYGTIANYSCETGFVFLKEEISRTCVGNETSVLGFWTDGTEPPTCGMLKYFLLVPTAINCFL